MATYELQRKCAICGALIGDSNPDGLGGECRPRFRKAVMTRMFSSEDWKNKYYACEAKQICDLLKEHASKHTLRSSFKKSFIPSVIEQFETRKFLSQKQKEIAWSIITNSGDFTIDYISETTNIVWDEQHKIIDAFFESITPEEKSNIIKSVIISYRN